MRMTQTGGLRAAQRAVRRRVRDPAPGAKVDRLARDVPEPILAGAPLPPTPSDVSRPSRGVMRRLADWLPARG